MTRAAILVAALASFAVAIGAAGTGGGVLIPDLPLGWPQPELDTKLVPFQASKASWCRQGHYITSWNLQVLETDMYPQGPDFLGKVSAVCDDGYELDYVSYSYDSEPACKNVRKVSAKLLPRAESTPDSSNGFTSITYRAGKWVDKLQGIGGSGGDAGSAHCPDNTLITGYIAASSCYGVIHFQAICGTV